MNDTHAASDDALYAEAYRPRQTTFQRLLWAAWTAAGVSLLVLFAWAEPWSGRVLAAAVRSGLLPAWARWAAVPAVMALRAVLLVETIGYLYHRFFQHVGLLTRRFQVIRRNQRFHWIHHMIIYPIGRLYKQAGEYVDSETGIAWSWVVPALISLGLITVTMGINLGSLVFMATIACYAKFVIDKTHSRFHLVEHPWTESPYFHWLEKIHILHHWDQRTNFTIVHPAMDWLFGTYRAPRTHERELKIAFEDKELTVSDLMNWRYLLIEATPSEYAAFISAARQHQRSLKKIGLFIELTGSRASRRPDDAQARVLHERALALLEACRTVPAVPAPAAAA